MIVFHNYFQNALISQLMKITFILFDIIIKKISTEVNEINIGVEIVIIETRNFIAKSE